jgi:hypothetical protein
MHHSLTLKTPKLNEKQAREIQTQSAKYVGSIYHSVPKGIDTTVE